MGTVGLAMLSDLRTYSDPLVGGNPERETGSCCEHLAHKSFLNQYACSGSDRRRDARAPRKLQLEADLECAVGPFGDCPAQIERGGQDTVSVDVATEAHGA
jgi:hypothetical protein